MQIHLHDHSQLILDQSKMRSQHIRQAYNHSSNMPCNLPARWGLGTVSNWCVNCASTVLFLLECLWSAACKQKSGTSNSWASRCALSTMLRAMFSQYIPTTWPCLNRSVVNSLRQFSILRERNFCQTFFWQRLAGRTHPHGRRDGGKFCVQKPFSFLQIDYCLNTHYHRLSSVVLWMDSLRHFANKLFPNRLPVKFHWLAWSARNRQRSTRSVCGPSIHLVVRN